MTIFGINQSESVIVRKHLVNRHISKTRILLEVQG